MVGLYARLSIRKVCALVHPTDVFSAFCRIPRRSLPEPQKRPPLHYPKKQKRYVVYVVSAR